LDARLTTLLCKTKMVAKLKGVKTRRNLVKSSKKDYGNDGDDSDDEDEDQDDDDEKNVQLCQMKYRNLSFSAP
jgi:hypothetical protein